MFPGVSLGLSSCQRSFFAAALDAGFFEELYQKGKRASMPKTAAPQAAAAGCDVLF